MGAVAFIKIIHIGDMLEVVSVNFAILQSSVGEHIIVVFLDFQLVAFFSQVILNKSQNFCVRRGAGVRSKNL